MAELATIARPYAEALFRIARSSNLDTWADVLAVMAGVAAVPEVGAMSRDPRVPRDVVISTFLEALKIPVSAEAKNLVEMLVENGRLSLLPAIEHHFHDLKNAFENTADAEVVSAFPMSESQLAALLSVLEKKFGRKLNPTVSVDPELIGGVRVTVGDEVLDHSVSARLEHMHTTLVA